LWRFFLNKKAAGSDCLMSDKNDRRVLVIQNVAIEGPGVIGPAMTAAGWELDTRLMDSRQTDLPSSLQGYQAMMILGGPMNVYEMETYPYLRHVDKLVVQGLERDLPMLGLCLGAQILAKNLGATVMRNRIPEIGWYPVRLTAHGRISPLFAGFPECFPVFQWHEDRFQIPHGAIHLATADACAEQAFSYGQRIFGLQFHLEVTTPMVISWLTAYRGDLAALAGPRVVNGTEPDQAAGLAHDIECRTREFEDAHYRRGAKLAHNWLAVCERSKP
jgi:GMP synthase-like glutamine amidotransferase